MRISTVAAAVAAVLGVSGTSAALAATGFTAASAAAAPSIYIGGSSAAANGVLSGFIENTVCGAGGNFTEWDTDTSVVGAADFRVVTCKVAAVLTSLVGQQVTFYYRPEGGSVIGAYAVINNSSISQINLLAQDATYTNPVDASHFMCPQNAALAAGKITCNSANGYIGNLSSDAEPAGAPNCAVGGGISLGGCDGWGFAKSKANSVIQHTLDVGITDAEPAAFGDAASNTAGPGAGNNDPVNYAAGAAIGANLVYNFVGASRTVDDLSNQSLLPQQSIFQQTFGFVVNKTGGAKPADLPKASLAAIFSGDPTIFSTIGGNSVPDWSKVALGTGAQVTTTPTQVIVCNREVGSGTRTTADLFLTQDGCNSLGGQPALFDYSINGIAGEPANNFATSLELDCVNKNANSIGYVSIDNFSKIGPTKTFPNVAAISVNSVSVTTGGNLVAASGNYEYVYEASMTENPSGSANGKAFYSAAFPKLQAVGSTSQSAQVTAIPGLQGNTVAYPPTAVGATPVYVSDYTRNGNSCKTLQKQ